MSIDLNKDGMKDKGEMKASFDLGAIMQGLTDAEVARREAKYGKNAIVEKPPKSFWERVKEGFEDPMIRLLCIVAGIMLVMTAFGQSEWYEPAGILATVCLVTFIQAKQGMASDSEFRKLKERTRPAMVKAMRNGVLTLVDPADIVPGDVLLVESGDKIEIDGHILSGNIKVSNATLNGESEPCKKFADPEYKIPTRVSFLDENQLNIGDISADVSKANYVVKLMTVTVDEKLKWTGNVYKADNQEDVVTVIREDNAAKVAESLGIKFNSEEKNRNVEVTISVAVDTDEFGRGCATSKVESIKDSTNPKADVAGMKVDVGVIECDPVYDDKYSIYKGEVVKEGSAYIITEYTGMDTDFGNIVKTKNSKKEIPTPLEVKLGALAKAISKFGYIGAITILVVQIIMAMVSAGGVGAFFAMGGSFVFNTIIEAASTAITIVVCAVPEGLPLMITIVLGQNSTKMFRDNVLVLAQKGIETAGSLALLFSDKTGTITKGILEVVRFFTADGMDIELKNIKDHKGLAEILYLAVCKDTTAAFDNQHKAVGGDITDKALLNFVGEDVFTRVVTNKENIRTEHQEFNSSNKFAQSRVENLGKTFYTGAPERLLAKAKKFMDANGEVHDINMEVVKAKMLEYQKQALRVLAFGYSEQPMVRDSINDDIVIIGLVGIRDDVRPEARDAIQRAQKAHIQVVMITGDNEDTAIAIARDAHLLGENSERLTNENKARLLEKHKNISTSTDINDGISVSSAMLKELTDDEVKILVSAIRVISRALPTDKSRMVRLCQEMGLVAGMTGDGVNDSPALSLADVGFAMGSGTDAAKDSAEIIITDDNFASIVKAILYGRTIYKNIQKFCRFQLSFNAGAVMLNLLYPMIAAFSGNPMLVATGSTMVLFGVVQMLVTNFAMDTGGGLMFGKEPAMESYMDEIPRRRDESIITKDMFSQVAVFTVYMIMMEFIWFTNPYIASLFDSSLAYKTAFYVTFMFTGMVGAWNSRTEGLNLLSRIRENMDFVKLWVIMIAAVTFMCAVGGPVAKIFNCAPFGIGGWVAAIVVAIGIIPVDMARKVIIGYMNKGKEDKAVDVAGVAGVKED